MIDAYIESISSSGIVTLRVQDITKIKIGKARLEVD